MKCPLDSAVLEVSERHGIEIDYCPTCRGVWLDRGELDKILTRTSEDDSRRWRDDDDDDARGARRDDDRDDRRSGSPKKKRRSSFFSELFEFGE